MKESYDEVLVVLAGVDQHDGVAVPRFEERDVRVPVFAEQDLPADSFDVGVPVRRRVRRKELELVLAALRFEEPHAGLSSDHHVFDVLQRTEGWLLLEAEALELVDEDLLRVHDKVVVGGQDSRPALGRFARDFSAELVATDHAGRQVSAAIDHDRGDRFRSDQVPYVACKRLRFVVVQDAGEREGLLVSLEGEPSRLIDGGLDVGELGRVGVGVEPLAGLGAGVGEYLGYRDAFFEYDHVEADVFVVHELRRDDVASDGESGVHGASDVCGDDGLLDAAAFLRDRSVPRRSRW